LTAPRNTREQVVGVYRDLAKRYDFAIRLYYLLGYRHRTYRRKAVQALRLRPGDTVVEIGCGTGLNFPLVERQIGPEGRLVGVDLTNEMLAQAERRVGASGWKNVSLVRADALEFQFPSAVDAIISTYALSLMPECAEVIGRGCEALAPGGRWAVLDVKLPEEAPGWLERVGLAALRPFAVTEEWRASRPWEAVRAAMRANLTDFSWTELYLGFAYLASGARGAGGGQ
jgi:demethylmenaquinone methyltransferase/2-methoxy-6-polyprenyl-1,4-benzoquinol methylase